MSDHTPCTQHPCTQPASARGLCLRHYQRAHRLGTLGDHPTRTPANQKHCKFAECTSPGTRRGMCQLHYNREWRAGRIDQHASTSIEANNNVPAGPVIEHLRRLVAGGIPIGRVVELTGTNMNRVRRLATGVDHTDSETAGRLLLLHLTVRGLPDAAQTLALGARRRMQALMALGWSVDEIARRIGVTTMAIECVLDHRTVALSVGSHWRTDAAFKELSLASPLRPDRDALARANAGRWPSTLVWNDIDLDHERFARPSARTA